MASDATDSADVAPMTPEVGSPFLAAENPIMVLDEAISSELQEFSVSTEFLPDLATPSMATNDSSTVLDKATEFDTQQLAVPNEDTADIAPSLMATNDSNMVGDETISLKTQEAVVPTEATTDMIPHSVPVGDSNMILDMSISKYEAVSPEDTTNTVSPSMAADGSNLTVDETIAPEIQELVVQIEDTTDISPPSLDIVAPPPALEPPETILPEIQDQRVSVATPDIGYLSMPAGDAEMVASETVSQETQDLAFSEEAASDTAPPTLITDTPTATSESFDMSALETQDQSVSAKNIPGLGFPPLAAIDTGKATEPVEKSSTHIVEIVALAEALPDTVSTIATDISTMISSETKVGLSDTQEDSVAAEVLRDVDSLCTPAGDTNMFSKSIATRSVETPELFFPEKTNQNTSSPSFVGSVSNLASKGIEMGLPEFQEESLLTETTSYMTFFCVPGGDIDMLSEPIDASPTELQERVSSAKATPDTDAPSMVGDISISISENIEMRALSERQEALFSTGIMMDLGSPGTTDGNAAMLFESTETSSTATPEPAFSAEVTQDTASSSLADDRLVLASETTKMSFEGIEEVPLPAKAISNTMFPSGELWNKENTSPANTKSEGYSWGKKEQVDGDVQINLGEQALEDFGRNKRKLSEESDDIIRESPASKRTAMSSPQDATISGVLSPPMSPVTFRGSCMLSELDEKCSAGISEFSISAHLRPPFSMDLKLSESVITQISPSLPADVGQPQFKRNLANKTLLLYIGPKKKCVLVHKCILDKSPFFASLFLHNSVYEELSQAYHFPAFDTYAFATIIHWLHFGKIKLIAEDYKENDVFDTTHMVKVYCLCYKLELRSLTNLALELLGYGYLKNNSAPTIEDMDIAYSQTSHWSGLRIYMATWARCRQQAPPEMYLMATQWDPRRFSALTTKHPDLLKDLQTLCESTNAAYLKNLDPRHHDICWYHNHPNGEWCGISRQTFKTVCNEISSRLDKPI